MKQQVFGKCSRCDRGSDAGQGGGAGSTIDQGNPINHKTGGERTQEEILDAGFLGLGAGPRPGGQYVQRQGEKFQRQEDDDQVGGLSHQHHAGGAEKDQYVIFTALDVHALEVPIGNGDAQ